MIKLKVRADARAAEREFRNLSRDIERVGTKGDKALTKVSNRARSATKEFKRMGRSVESTSSSMRLLNMGIGKLSGVLGAGALLGSINSLINSTREYGDKLHKLNLRLNFSVETLDKLKHISDLSGVSFGSVTSAISIMSRNIDNARRGLKEATEAFDELGINVDDLLTRAPEEQFLQISEALEKLENPTIRNATAMKILGRSASDLMSMLPDLRNQLEETDTVFDKEMVTSIAAFNDSITKLKRGLNQELAPSIERTLNALRKFIDYLTEHSTSVANLVTSILESLVPAAKVLRLHDEIRKATGPVYHKIIDPNKQHEPLKKMGLYKKEIAPLKLEEIRERAKKITPVEIIDVKTFERMDKTIEKVKLLDESMTFAARTNQMFSESFADSMVDVFMGISNAEDAIRSLASTFLSSMARAGMTKFATGLFGGTEGVGGLFGELFGAKKGGIFKGGFQSFASGGIARQPTLGLVGEGQSNEAIVPLPDGRSIPVEMRNQQPTVYNIHINANDPKSFAELLRRNPEGTISVIQEAANKGNSTLKNSIRKATR